MTRNAGSIAVLGLLLAACGRDAALTSNVALADLLALPAELQPGATVVLRPIFRSGTGRIDPDVGPVTSGGSYVVGPFAEGRQYTLTVTDGASTLTSVLDLPFTYRERVTQLTASTTARSEHAALRLDSGAVFVAGGRSTGVDSNDSAETFDPATFAYAPVGNLSTGRRNPQLVLQPDGSVLSFGGLPDDPAPLVASLVEQWGPTLPAWSAVGNLLCSRVDHTVTRLADGRVLVLGGDATGGAVGDEKGEVWVPGVGSRLPLVALPTHRVGHTATELVDGRVLVVGGRDPSTGLELDSAEIFDPTTESVVPTGSMAIARARHAAVRIADGKVLVIGGVSLGGTLRSAEVYDPATGVFAATGDLVLGVGDVRALRLPSGEVLVAGGQTSTRSASGMMQAWSPATGAFRVFGEGMPQPRSSHSLTLLPDGRVLLYGGDPGTDFPTPATWLID